MRAWPDRWNKFGKNRANVDVLLLVWLMTLGSFLRDRSDATLTERQTAARGRPGPPTETERLNTQHNEYCIKQPILKQESLANAR